MQAVEREIKKKMPFVIATKSKIEYTDKVTLEISGDKAHREEIISAITEVTSGVCNLVDEGARKSKIVIDSTE